MSHIENIDVTFNPASVAAFGELLCAALTPQYQGTFEYTVDNTELNTNTVANGGTVTQATAKALVGTSITTASTAMLQSKQHAKYRSGFGGLARFTAMFTTPVALTDQFVGIMDTTGGAPFKNGLGVGYNNGTTFGFHRWANGSINTVAQSAWDDPMDGTGDSGMTLDQTKLNVFQIRFQFLGAGAIQLFIESDTTGGFVLAHTIHFTNQNTLPSSYNPNYHHTIYVDNKATVSDLVVSASSYAYFIEGKTMLKELHQPQFSTGLQQQTTVTTETAIVTIRNKSSYASKTNYIDLFLELIFGSIEANSANNLGSIRLVKNATLGGTPAYTDINTTDSVVDFDVAGTTVTGGKTLFSLPLAGKNDRVFQDVTKFNIILNPGEWITMAGTSANSATIEAGFLWKELF